MSPLITNVSQRFEKDMRLQIKYVITPTNATPATYRPKFIKNPLKYFLSNVEHKVTTNKTSTTGNNNIHDLFSSTLSLFNTDVPDTCRP